MRGSIKVAVVATVVLFATMAMAGDSHWFDMENCGMCKPFMKHDKLIDNCNWESYPIKSGLMMVTVVNDNYMSAFQMAQTEMNVISEKLKAGKDVQLCGSCNALSALFPRGLTAESIDTPRGNIHLFTAGDPEVVSALQKWDKRNSEEMKKYMEMKETKAN